MNPNLVLIFMTAAALVVIGLYAFYKWAHLRGYRAGLNYSLKCFEEQAKAYLKNRLKDLL